MTSRPLQILFASCQTISLLGDAGGVRNEILAKKHALEARGHRVDLWNSWAAWRPDYDLVHLFVADLRTLFVAEAVKKWGAKLVVSPIIDRVGPSWKLDLGSRIGTTLPKLWTNLGAARHILRLADAVCVRSNEEYQRCLQAFGVPEKRVGIVAQYIPEATRELHPKPEHFVSQYGADCFLLAVGQIGNPRKNFAKLIEVVGSMGVPLFIAGALEADTETARIKRLAARYPSVHLLGYVDRDMLLSAMAACHAFAMPSTVEGIGLAGLEAGVLGANLVITKNGGPPFYFGPHAEYVDPFDNTSIKRGVKRAMSTSKSSNLRDHLLSSFTSDRTANELEQLYQQVIGGDRT